MSDDDVRPGAAREIRVGSSIGKYTLVRLIGSGGMGMLYEARHVVLANRLAIKTLRPALAADGAERFRNEALAASRLRDDRLPQIFDIDELDDGTQYIVMEYLEGEDLAHRLTRGPLAADYAARLVFEVLDVLAKVHTLGIVHRDIKPANIFIARSNVFGEIPKLLDFGVAHIGSSAITHAGQVLGTPAYMAPEQVHEGGRIGPWTDVFAAAVVLFELIAGARERPWVADSPLAYLAVITAGAPPRTLSSVAPWVHPALSAAIERGLQRDPARRYQDALEFARAIEPFAVDRSVLYTRAAAAVPAASAAAASDTQSTHAATVRETVDAAVPSPLLARRITELRGARAQKRETVGQAPPDPEQLEPGERRLMVLAYADVRLHQTSGRPLAAEDSEQLLSQVLDLFCDELSQQGARCLPQPGSGVLAVFGGERLNADDVERAFVAALGVGDRRDDAHDLLSDVGISITTRIGVHRGFVARRAGFEGAAPVSGDTVATVKHLAEHAPLNGILATRDAVEGLGDWLAVRSFGRLTLPGRVRPVDAVEVLGTVRTATDAVRRAFVGREVALQRLDAMLSAAQDADTPAVVAIAGAPGVGKTRLVNEWVTRTAERLAAGSGAPRQVVRVQPMPRVAYGLWVSLLEELLGRTTTAAADRSRALDALASALEPERRDLLLQQRAIVATLVGGGDGEVTGSGAPAVMADRIAIALTLCLEAAARRASGATRPLIVVLDNLHRADAASLALLPRVLGAAIGDCPPLVVLTMRVALPDDLPRGTTIVELDPLTDDEAMALARALAAPSPVSAAVERLVVERAGGNPLFIEQLVSRLEEEGLLGASELRLRGITPPVSLYGVFLERVDRLEAPLAEALRLASVLGVEFEPEVYQRVSERAARLSAWGSSRWTPAAALAELVARGFLVKRESPAGDLYAFEPPPMQAAVVGTVLAENRRILHGLTADALESVYAGRLPRQFARILHHYSQSANVASTVRYARLAGERALVMAAYDDAAEHLGIAAALQDRVAGTPLDAAETLHRLATALEWKGQLRQASTRAEEAASRLDGAAPLDRASTERRARIAVTAGELYGLLGSWQRAIDAYADAERLFTDVGLTVEAAEARCCRGFAHRPLGQWVRGAELAAEGWAVLEQTGDLPAIARAGHELGNLLRDLGRYEESLRIFDRAVESGDALRRDGRLSESMWGAIAARSGRAMTYAASGDLAAAIADQRAANDLARRDGNRVAEAISEYHLATHYLELGDLDATDQSAERAYRQARDMDMPGRTAKCRLVQARACIRGGQWEQALQRIRDAFVDTDQRRIPDDALITAVELLVSAVDRVPAPVLIQAVRSAWPFVTRASASDRLRAGLAALQPLLGMDDDLTRPSNATGG